MIIFLITLLNLGFLAASAIAACVSVSTAKQNSQGTVAKQLIEEYSEPAMCEALRILGKWRNDNEKNFAKVWKEKLKEDDKNAQGVEGARRKVSHFFQKIFSLRQMGIINKKAMTYFSGYDGVDIFLGIVEPMEYELNKLYDKHSFNGFRKSKGMPSMVDTGIPPHKKD